MGNEYDYPCVFISGFIPELFPGKYSIFHLKNIYKLGGVEDDSSSKK